MPMDAGKPLFGNRPADFRRSNPARQAHHVCTAAANDINGAGCDAPLPDAGVPQTMLL